MAGKAINQYNTFSGSASDVNVLVQETSQTDPNTYEHKKAKLDTIIATLKNIANGLAGLDGNGMIPESLLPAKYDDVVEGYYYNGVFYTTSAHTTAMTATTGRIYIDLGGTGNLYRYTGSAYVQVTDNDLRGDVEEDVAEIEADLANTNNRVTSNSQRIANIEDKSEPFTIEYPSADYGKGTVPASIEKSGMSVKVKGKSRAWNNGAREINTTNYIAEYGTDVSIADGVIDIYGNVVVSEPSGKRFSTIAGNSYLVAFEYQNTASATTQLVNYVKGDIIQTFDLPSASSFTTYAFVFACGNSVTNDTINFSVRNYSSGNLKIKGLIFRNLTTILDDWNPSDITTANIPLMVQQVPDLLKYDAYDAGSLVDTEVSGVKSVGVNIWDEEWENGYYTASGKQSGPNYIRSKNYIKGLRNIYFNSPVNLDVYGYSSDTVETGTLIGNGIKNTNVDASLYAFIRFSTSTIGTSSYGNNIQLCDNSLPSSVKTVYHPYSSDSITFSEPVTLRSAGSVEDELTPESGKVTRYSKEVIDLSSLTWNSLDSSYTHYFTSSVITGIKGSTNNAICPRYSIANVAYSNMPDKSIRIEPSGQITIRDDAYSISDITSFKNSLSELGFVGELATPTTETISPSPTALAVEPYGEVSLIQDQDIELDGGFSMRYIPDSPYVKKADIVDNLNSSDVSKPLSANMGRVIGATLDQHDSRIKNLEQKAGDYVEVNYRGTNAVPTGKAKYGLVDKIVGKSRAWNQLVQNGNFASTSGWESSGATISASNNVLSLTASAQGGFVRLSSGNKVIFNVNDILLATFMIKGTSSTTIQYTCQNNNYIFNESVSVTTSWKQVVLRRDLTGRDTLGYIFFFDNRESGWDTIYIKEVCIYDLTLIFGPGNEPSTVADAVAQIPDLLKYNAYDAGSLVDTEVSGVKSVGVNIWDEETELGNIYNPDGSPTSDSYQIRASNYTKVSPNATLYFYCGSGDVLGLFAYDAGKNFIGVYVSGSFVVGSSNYTDIGHHSITLPANCHYIKIKFGSSYGTTYKHDTQIVDDPLPSSIKTVYHPYKSDTLFLSTPVTLRSAGSVADELDVESGIVQRRCYKQKITTVDYKSGATGTHAYRVQLDHAPHVFSTSFIANITSNRFETISWNTAISGKEGFCCNGQEEIYLSFGLDSNFDSITKVNTWLGQNDVYITYEPSTYPNPESIDPITDNFLEVEGGGTVETIQTQTPTLDNCLDVGYLAV